MPSRLILIKALHTLVWLFFVCCIVAAPLAAHFQRFALAAWLIACVAVEALVLLLNRWTCPLTTVAAQYTADRAPNFDIYLPRWLAQHNKAIFTPLYLASASYVVIAWWRHGA